MRKRERENPCAICGHYHKYEEGEVCGICGHSPVLGEKPSAHFSAFPSEILPEFLYLGSYYNASRSQLLRTQGISCILNTVPACQNLYNFEFLSHRLQEDSTLQFDDAIQFIEQCEMKKTRVLVHCMSGKSRSAAFVVAYLMKSKAWRLQESYRWVKDRRPVVEITQDVLQHLQEFEQKIFGAIASKNAASPQLFSNPAPPVFNFGIPERDDQADAPAPAFNTLGTTSMNENYGSTDNNNNIPMDSS